MSEPRWIQDRAVLGMHEEQLKEHGGPEGVRDMGLLESALARPKNILAYAEQTPSLGRLAAAYAKGIVANHPFVDGNKRTAFVVSLTFLSLNGLKVTASKEDRILTFWKLADGSLSEDELAVWFERNSAPR
ncbi:MAG TPA: type II toxin-antitoxin system death-on-curing family toxin [Terracidiphilus sp.]|jgi:death-on-curing protein|nr:type II toxin-antitoxin system death-on-curing family toxin [Terracidiphilus sp.]